MMVIIITIKKETINQYRHWQAVMANPCSNGLHWKSKIRSWRLDINPTGVGWVGLVNHLCQEQELDETIDQT
jgi:hypothetical protein